MATVNTVLAVRIGRKLAREVFEKRGNRSEAHISEAELAGLLMVAALTMARQQADIERAL